VTGKRDKLPRGATERRANDYYPTPFDAGTVLGGWLWAETPASMTDRLCDPCAGAGVLIMAVQGVIGGSWAAMELDPQLMPALRRVVPDAWRGDALDAIWPKGHFVVMNPPFSLLDEFVALAIEYLREGHIPGFAVLTRVTWIDDGLGRNMPRRIDAYGVPDTMVRMPWRQSFTGDGKTDSTSHCWLIYKGPERPDMCRTFWAERPVLTGDQQRLWASMQPKALFGAKQEAPLP
jgi:hypothetical protein